MSYGVFLGLATATIATAVLVFGKFGDQSVFVADIFTFAGLLIFLLSLGVICGSARVLAPRQVTIFCAIGLVSLFAGGRCFRGYRFYADHFAKAIWRDFVEHRLAQKSGGTITDSK